MLSLSDLVAPVFAFAAGLPAVTLALLLWRRTRDRSFELLATGLGLLAILAFLMSAGIFLMVTRVVANPDLHFVLWNTTFIFSFVSLVVLRRFTSLVVPGPQTDRSFPRAFSALSALLYGTILVLAFVPSPPPIDFRGRAVYALSAVYYFCGFLGPTLRLWKARALLPSWVARIFARGPFVVGLPLIALALYECLRWASVLDSAWPSLGPLATLGFFGLVTIELFRILVKGAEARGSGTEYPSPTDGPADRANRIASRCVADPLTRRELEVLALLLEGWRNQDIAGRLGLSPNTVKNHVYNLYQKTGVANRVELMSLGE